MLVRYLALAAFAFVPMIACYNKEASSPSAQRITTQAREPQSKGLKKKHVEKPGKKRGQEDSSRYQASWGQKRGAESGKVAGGWRVVQDADKEEG